MYLKYTETHVSSYVTELCEAAELLMRIEREKNMTHTQRNHFRAVMQELISEIKKTVAARNADENNGNIPF